MLGARAASRQKRNSFTSNWDTTQAGSANDTTQVQYLVADGELCISGVSKDLSLIHI